jgi:hypothetical protein
MKNSKQYIMQLNLVKEDIKEYKILPEEDRSDFHLSLEAFKSNYHYYSKIDLFTDYFQYVPNNLRQNKEFIYECVKLSEFALDFIPETIQTEIEFIKKLIKVNGQAITFLPKDLIDKDTAKMCLEITPVNHTNLLSKIYKQLPIHLQKDEELIEYYFKQGGLIENLLPELRANKRIVLLALDCTDRVHAMKHIIQMDKILYTDKEIMLKAVEKNGRCLEFAIPEFQADKNFVLCAMKSNGNGLKFANKKYKDDEDIVSAALQNTGEALEFASDRLKNNHSIVYQAIYQYKEAIRFASENLKKEVGLKPLEYLKPFFMCSELQKNLPTNINEVNKKKIKL